MPQYRLNYEPSGFNRLTKYEFEAKDDETAKKEAEHFLDRERGRRTLKRAYDLECVREVYKYYP